MRDSFYSIGGGMVEYKKGYFARSKAGHDKGKTYIIIEGTQTGRPEDFVFLVDGECKLLENPKKKNIKHLFLEV